MNRTLRAVSWWAIALLGLAGAGCEVDKALDDAAKGKTEGREHIGGAASPVMSDELFSSSNRASQPPKAAAPAAGSSSAPPTPSSRPPVPAASAPPTPAPVPAAGADEASSGDDEAGDDEATAAAPPARSLRKLDVELSTGVSLAQTGPEGTLMSFSVDYQFTAAPPSAGARYGVVVQRRDGQALMQEEQLQIAATVELLVPKWRPDDGPFYAFIVELDSQGRPIAKSGSLELTGPSDR